MSGLALIIAFVVAIIVMIVAISKFKVHPFLAIIGISIILALLAGMPLTSSTTAVKTVEVPYASMADAVGLTADSDAAAFEAADEQVQAYVTETAAELEENQSITAANITYGESGITAKVTVKTSYAKNLIDSIGGGFSSTFTSIGIVIILGALIGSILEKTGAALKLADMVIKLVGEKHPALAIELMGWVVSIPVFCDSGFVILNPIRKALVKRTGASSVTMTVALAAGLYISHVFIPPTPGPIAAAQTLGVGGNLLMVMGFGVLCSVFPILAGLVYAKFIGKKVKSADETGDNGEVVKTYEELVAEYGKLPSGINALAPLIVPIILMALSSISSMAGWTGTVSTLLTFFGTPIIALAIGTIFAVAQLITAKKGAELYELTNDTLKTVGPILFVTAAGSVLGKVISNTTMVDYIKANAEVLEKIGIFFPFLLAAILKSAQGSSTVAITTTAGIVSPLLASLGFTTPASVALVVMAIGAGAMTVSHANDSYFWVVTNFGEMTPSQGYKTQTMLTLVMGIASIIEVFLLNLIF